MCLLSKRAVKLRQKPKSNVKVPFGFCLGTSTHFGQQAQTRLLGLKAISLGGGSVLCGGGMPQGLCYSKYVYEMNITPRRRGKSPRPHSQPHSPVPSLLLEPSSRPTSSGGVPWEPGFKTQLVTSLRSPGRGHAQDMAGPREDGGCMRFWEARSRTGRRGS